MVGTVRMGHVGKGTVNQAIDAVKTNRIDIGDITLVGDNDWVRDI